MRSRPKNSRIHTLAMNTVRSIEKAFWSITWFNKSDEVEVLSQLKDFLNSDDIHSDDEIIEQFQLAIDDEQYEISDTEDSIFLTNIKLFIEHAMLIVELNQLKATNTQLHKDFSSMKGALSHWNKNDSSFSIFFQFPDLFGYALLFLDIKHLCLVSTVSQDFSKNITLKEIKEAAIEKRIQYLNTPIHLSFLSVFGRKTELDTTLGCTIKELKRQYHEIEPMASICLFNGKKLIDDNKIVDDYNITNNSNIHTTR